jgi:pantothenate kinase
VSDQVTISLPSTNTSTLGNTTIYGLTTTVANLRAVPVTFSENGQINSISIYHNGGAGNVLLGVYSDQNGSPSSLLGVTASTAINSSAGWQTVSLTSPVTVTSGQKVWLSFVFQNNPGVRYTNGTPARAQSTATWAAGMPSTFGIASYADYKFSIFCNYVTNTAVPALTVSPAGITLDYASGAGGTFNITSNTGWSVTDNASWLELSPVSGTNNGTITLSANSANSGSSARTATVTITGTGVSAKTVTVTQEAAPVTTSTLGNTTIYGLTTTVANLRAVPVTFSENGQINSISIYHNGGAGNVLLGVYSDQNGSPSSLLGVTASTAINSSAGWQTVSLTSPVTVTSGQKVWLSFVFQNNPGVRYTNGTPARAQSTATWAAGMPSTFGIASYADYKFSIYCNYVTNTAVPALTVSPAGITLDYASGASGTFNITSNTGWSVTDNASWLELSPVSGTNNGTITLSANSANSGSSARTATVTITGTGVSAKTVTVTQEAAPVTTSTLGNTTIYGLTTTVANLRAVPVTFNENGQINSISIYHNGGTGNVLLGVYSDQTGSPSSRLGVTSSTAVNSSAGWQTVSLTSPVTVTSGQKVWLSFVFQNNPGVRYTNGTPARAQSTATWAAGMPSTFGIASYADYKFSIFCNYVTNTAVPALTVSPAGITLDYASGAGGTFNITSNTGWSVTDNASWLELSPVSGTNNGTITLSANSANTGTSARTAIITITGTGISAQTVTVTQEAAPVTTSTLGNTTVFGSTTTVANLRAVPVTFSENGQINSISVYHNGGSGNVILGVYSDQAGSPSSRLGVTASTVVNSVAGWQTISLTSSVSVTSGQKVWLSFVFQNNPGVRYSTGTPARAQSTTTWSAGMPATFGTASYADNKYSIYCTFTVNPIILKDASILKDFEKEPVQILSVDDDKKELNDISVENVNTLKTNDFKLYPNPANSFVNVDYSDMPELGTTIEIIDSNGRTLYKNQAESNLNRIDINQLPVGLYFIRSFSHQKYNVKKLIVK